jgi:glutamate/tyrosine decarboxylase-like PLP-dependent enzyme
MSLDPESLDAFRAQAHAMLDAMLDHHAAVAAGPVWRPMPAEVRAAFRAPLPMAPTPLAEVDAEFRRHVLPYGNGSTHPRFVGWVHGGGTLEGMLAEMLAAGMNANLGGRDHAPVEVERQIVRWMAELFGFPKDASGLLVTGTSMANFLAVVVAKVARLGRATRAHGLAAEATRLVAYASRATHGCVARAMELSGLGSDALRTIAIDGEHRIDLDDLRRTIAADRAAGLTPFLVVGNAGTVDVGAIDDLDGLATLAKDESLWFHVDGAFGSLCVLSPDLAPKVAGIERADSIACDFHKWAQVPYDAGFLIVRDPELHRQAFASEPSYLARETRGLAANAPCFTDFGADLSRGFRALKVWFTFKTFGIERLGEVILATCNHARSLEARIRAEPRLELLAPVALNVVCFRVRAPTEAQADELARTIVIELQESGIAVPSTTRIDGKLAIRVAIVNHRWTAGDGDVVIDAILARLDR